MEKEFDETLEEELKKVRRRTEKRLEQYKGIGESNRPINSATDHLGKIEGYPTTNLSRINMKALPRSIRVLGYTFLVLFGLFFLAFIVLKLIEWIA